LRLQYELLLDSAPRLVGSEIRYSEAREREAMAQLVNESIEVQAPVGEIFTYWSNFENFPSFMQNVEEVRMTGEDMSHWKVKGPLGKSVEFDAKTTEMDPNRGIGWNTVNGEVMTSGEVRFEEIQPDRTRVDVTMNYADPPGGKVGEVVANAISNPEREVREDLQNFARLVERGELGGV
jgi:uncharacterized membrane protein